MREEKDVSEDSKVLRAVCGIDWLELAGGIDWSKTPPGVFDELAQLKKFAQQTRKAVPVPFLGDSVFLEPRGIGSGRDSHKEYCFSDRGVTVAISGRDYRGRKLHNFMLRVPGDACLILGVEAAWEIAWSIVERLGGTIIDEWIRRLDIAVDLPGLSVRDELVPAVQQRRFVTTAKEWQLHESSEGATGFAFGKAPRVRIVCYDKKLEAGKRSPLYRQAMIDRRWGGTEPDSATRVEWQIGREWFDEYGVDGASQAIAELPAIAAKLTADEPRSFLRLTTVVPDRENRHQDRAETLPVWDQIRREMRNWSGPASAPLQRICREQIDAPRAFQMVRGCITSFAILREKKCEGLADAHRLLDEMHRINRATDADWHDSWVTKARASGLLAYLKRLPPSSAA